MRQPYNLIACSVPASLQDDDREDVRVGVNEVVLSRVLTCMLMNWGPYLCACLPTQEMEHDHVCADTRALVRDSCYEAGLGDHISGGTRSGQLAGAPPRDSYSHPPLHALVARGVRAAAGWRDGPGGQQVHKRQRGLSRSARMPLTTVFYLATWAAQRGGHQVHWRISVRQVSCLQCAQDLSGCLLAREPTPTPLLHTSSAAHRTRGGCVFWARGQERQLRRIPHTTSTSVLLNSTACCLTAQQLHSRS